MSKVRVPWDGPNPCPGDWIIGKAGFGQKILSVETLRRADSSGARLVLDLARVAPVPPLSVVIPRSRIEFTKPAGPPRVRQLADCGANAVMRSSWRDPSDTKPNASHRPKEITGFRTFCPLRRMAALSGSEITVEQIHAADLFRAQWDLTKIGYSGTKAFEVNGIGYGPISGPSSAAVAQALAGDAIGRVIRRFSLNQLVMLEYIILGNHSIYAWCQLKKRDAKVELGRLLSILEVLQDSYATEIEQEEKRGKVVA